MSGPTVLLISPPVLYAASWWHSEMPSKPHLSSLAGFVRDIATVRILDLDLIMGAPPSLDAVDAFIDQVDEHLSLDGIDLVGISCWTSLHYLGAVAVAKRVRKLQRQMPIVVGGHHATALPSDFITEDNLFDYIVVGDGEHVLRAMCEETAVRPQRAKVMEGTPFAMTDPNHIDWETYPWHNEERREMWVSFSRGCPFECTYCVEPQHGQSCFQYDVEDALGILEQLSRTHNPRVICFSDPVFGANRRWTEALLEGIEALELPTMFWAETRADVLNPRLLDRLRSCQFKVDFGLDTGSKTMVERMAKSRSPESYLKKARENLRHSDAIALHHDVYLVFNTPGETPETARETMAFVEEIADIDGPLSSWVSSQSFFILPGTHVYDRMDKYRLEWGTEIRHPTWWREQENQHRLATDVLPSTAFEGRENELSSYQKWQNDINIEWTQRHSDAAMSFAVAFFKG